MIDLMDVVERLQGAVVEQNEYIGQLEDQVEMYREAWIGCWDTICEELPDDIKYLLLSEGSGKDNAVDTIRFLASFYKEHR